MKKTLMGIFFTLAFVLTLGYLSVDTFAGSSFPVPVASGVNVNGNERAEIDYSNVRDGYVMIRFLNREITSVRVTIVGPDGINYQYRLNTDGRWEVFPLTAGNGSYTIRVFQNVSGNQYSLANSLTVDVTLTNEFAPFLRPNQFVDFAPGSRVVTQANSIVRNSGSALESVSLIYNWVIENIEYDFAFAARVANGQVTTHVPDLAQTMQTRMGICFDYASLMTAMLRSQGIPTRLVIGYVGDVFHAWISIHTPETGWINNIIWFDGAEWRIMDPTFAATGNQSAEAMRLIGNGQNHRSTHYH